MIILWPSVLPSNRTGGDVEWVSRVLVDWASCEIVVVVEI